MRSVQFASRGPPVMVIPDRSGSRRSGVEPGGKLKESASRPWVPHSRPRRGAVVVGEAARELPTSVHDGEAEEGAHLSRGVSRAMRAFRSSSRGPFQLESGIGTSARRDDARLPARAGGSTRRSRFSRGAGSKRRARGRRAAFVSRAPLSNPELSRRPRARWTHRLGSPHPR